MIFEIRNESLGVNGGAKGLRRLDDERW